MTQQITAVTRDTNLSSTPPARPRRLKIEFVREPGLLRLRYRRRQWGTAVFLGLWLTGWTVGCIFLAGMFLAQRELFVFLFGLPFWASWIFVAFQVISAFWHQEELQLDAAGASFQSRVLVPRLRRRIPLAEIKDFTACEKVVDSENGTCEGGIEMRTLGVPLQFAYGLEEQERVWLLHALNAHFAELIATRDLLPLKSTATPAALPTASRDPERVEVLLRSETPVSPPSDCRWQLEEDFEGLLFRQRGRFDPLALATLLFINCFWNGIVGVFLLGALGFGPQGAFGQERWFLMVFLIPFEAIGLAIFAGLLLHLFEPVRQCTWRFTDDAIHSRITWFGLGPSWTYAKTHLQRIELRYDESAGASRRSINPRKSLPWNLESGAAYELGFVGDNDVDLCEFTGLTEGEARWIANVVLTASRGS